MSQTEHFDRIASRYDELRAPRDLTPVQELLAQEGELTGKRVLDIGCGTGSTLELLALHYAVQAAGVDPSEEMLRVARAKLSGTAELRHGAPSGFPSRTACSRRR